MKQSNYFLLALGLMTLGACTGQKTPSSLATAWQAKHLVEVDSLTREVASSNQPGMCLQNIFNSSTLKKEVADYEKRFTGVPVAGYWKHLDLSALPTAQANFLKRYGDSIGDQANPESISYEGCSSLPCIFNRVYGKDENHVAGYVHYLWFLKFDNYLSLDNKVPDQQASTPGIYNGKQFRVSDYLYNETELYGLWRITHLLQDPYTSLSNLKEVQRIPRKENLEGYGERVCGLASSQGHIRLQDGCLNTASYNKDKGFLYIGVIHEMSHMVDYLQAKQRRSGGWYRSHEQDYLDIVGFYKTEYTDSAGKLVTEWKLKENAKTIRSYSATTPVENFADTLAYFRQDGEEAKSKIDIKQFKWVAHNYFSGEAYDKLGNRERLLKKYDAAFSGEILAKVMDCSSTQKAFQSSYFTANDFSQSRLTPWMLKCISYEAEVMASRLIAHVKTYEADGCTTLATRDDELVWNASVKSSLKKQFSIYIEEISKDPEYLEKVKDFNLALQNRSMANEAILQCYQGSTLANLSKCYEKKAFEIAKTAALELKLPENQAQEMAALYLMTHPYLNVSQDLYLSYRTILSAHDALIVDESEALWQMCLNMNHSDEAKHSGSLFSTRKGYLVSSFYNCLNTLMPTTLKEVVRSLEYDGQKITHPSEELILLEFLTPRFVEELQALHEKSAADEAVELSNHFAQISDDIRAHLLSDFSWVKSLTDDYIILEGCRVQALTQVSFLPLYHLKRDAFNDLITKGPCNGIMNEPALKEFLDKSKKEVENQIFSKVESTLTKHAEKRALYCKEVIPWKWERTKATVRLPRKGCMSLGWDDVERNTINELMGDPLANRFKMKDSDFRSEVSELKDSVRLKVEEEHF